MIRLKDFSYSFGKSKPLKIRSLIIPDRGAFLIYGDNGTGKTTLVRCITGIREIRSGKLEMDGNDLADMPRREIAKSVSYLPQTSDMDLDIPVERFIRQGLYAAGKGDFDGTVNVLGLKPFLKKNFGELSGGEKQLVRIARATVADVKYTFLDEPDSFLSRRNKERLMQWVGLLSEKRCVVIVSHDELKFHPKLKPLLELKHG